MGMGKIPGFECPNEDCKTVYTTREHNKNIEIYANCPACNGANINGFVQVEIDVVVPDPKAPDCFGDRDKTEPISEYLICDFVKSCNKISSDKVKNEHKHILYKDRTLRDEIVLRLMNTDSICNISSVFHASKIYETVDELLKGR